MNTRDAYRRSIQAGIASLFLVSCNTFMTDFEKVDDFETDTDTDADTDTDTDTQTDTDTNSAADADTDTDTDSDTDTDTDADTDTDTDTNTDTDTGTDADTDTDTDSDTTTDTDTEKCTGPNECPDDAYECTAKACRNNVCVQEVQEDQPCTYSGSIPDTWNATCYAGRCGANANEEDHCALVTSTLLNRPCDDDVYCNGDDACDGAGVCVNMGEGDPCPYYQQCNEETNACDCVVTGPEDCADGIDNDCSGFIDCPVITKAFPNRGKAAAGEHVHLEFKSLSDLTTKFYCRTARVADIDNSTWVPCDGAQGYQTFVNPKPELNGLTATEVRLVYSDGTYSDTVSWRYYVHNTLNGVARCPVKATDLQYFEKALERLNVDRTFPENGIALDNPFVRIAFKPPLAATWGINETDGEVEALTLRRRFVMNPERTLLLLTRVYQSRRNPGSASNCMAGSMRVHANCLIDATDTDTDTTNDGDMTNCSSSRHFTNNCDAFVFNAAGAAVCLVYNEALSAIEFASDRRYWEFVDPFKRAGVDHFMWRRLITRSTNNTARSFFSNKCYNGESCTNSDMIFLEDYDSYFADDVVRGPHHNYSSYQGNANWYDWDATAKNTGLVIRALKDVILTSFVFHNQGNEDTIRLIDASDLSNPVVVQSYSLAPSSTEQLCEVNWPLAKDVVYRLVTSTANYSYRDYGYFPTGDSQLLVQDSCSSPAGFNTCDITVTNGWNNFSDLKTVLR